MFHAERVLGGGAHNRVYHKKCAHCATCEKPLNSMILCNGKDGDIYCKSCYARKFGAPGYRGEYTVIPNRVRTMPTCISSCFLAHAGSRGPRKPNLRSLGSPTPTLVCPFLQNSMLTNKSQ